MASEVTILDGSYDFSGGVNSVKVTTVQSERNPNGLSRREVAWANNATFRDGGVYPRAGWQPVGKIATRGPLYQAGFMYNPGNDADPYLMLSLSGEIYKVEITPELSVTNLSNQFSLRNSSVRTISYMEQAERFLVMQSGDGSTLPLFWDGELMRRSLGIGGSGESTLPPGNTPGVFTVTLRNDDAQPSKSVPANSVTAPVGADNHGTGGLKVVYTGQVGAFKTSWITPAVGATITLEVTQDPTAALGKLVGISNKGTSPTITGTWTVTAVNVPTTGVEPVAGTTSEIPASGPMDYYMGRLWYAQGRSYSAGDIVQGESGTLAYDFIDSVLKVTENPLVIGGDGFLIPEGNEDIRAIEHNAVIDAALGQGRMFIFTRKAIYSMVVPVTRTDWINADSNNQPLQAVVQLSNGSVGDRCVVPVNGDLFFQSLEPGIRSITSAVRNFQQWGNTEISAPIRRLLQNNNRALMVHGGGAYFNNRLYQTALPTQSDGGVIHKAVASLDFTPISTLSAGGQEPIWEGAYEGLDFYQIFTGSFGGVERCFAVVRSQQDQSFELWELTFNSKVENGDKRISWAFESPAYTWDMEMELKRLVSGEIWFDRLYGTADVTIEYRPDSENCWFPWFKFRVCNPANTCEDPVNPICYPPVENGPSYRANYSLPRPPVTCAEAMTRPSDIGYQFQVRILVRGFLRVRGLLLHATRVERKLYANMPC